MLVPAAGDWKVQRWAVRGSSSGEPVLWMIDANGDVRNTTDPTSTSWSAADTVQAGQHADVVHGLVVMNNDIIVQHTGGLTAYDGTTVETRYQTPTYVFATNAARPFVWVDGLMYFTFGHELLAYDQPNNVVEVLWPGPERQGSDELNGTITAITGDEDFMYLALKNAAGNTYIMKGSPLTNEWHTLDYRGANDCEAMLRLPAASNSLDATNPQLALGDGGSADYFILPLPGYRPEDDSGYKFATTEGKLWGSWSDIGTLAYNKILIGGHIVLNSATADRRGDLKYEIDESGSIVDLVDGTSDGLTSANAALGVTTRIVRPVVTLVTNVATAGVTVLGYALAFKPVVPRPRMWTITVRIGDKLTTRKGKISDYSWDDWEAFLDAAVGQQLTLSYRGLSYTVHLHSLQGLGRTETRELFQLVMIEEDVT